MSVQVLIGNQKGPLPIQASFMAPGDFPMYLEVQGSVWTPTANQLIGIQVTALRPTGLSYPYTSRSS